MTPARTAILFITISVLGCRAPTNLFEQKEIDQHVPLAGVGPRFMLGVATSAHQIEGGNDNDWTDWERGNYPDGKPHVTGGASAARAADSWNLWRQDVAAVEQLGANVYRLGIEWSRLEPKEGSWNVAAAARYREMLLALRDARPRPIAPMLNLYHFTLPHWVVERGGWEWAGAPAAFAAFAARAGDAFGDVVDLWCTLNEPNVYATKSYMAGQWPPGVKDPARGARVLARLLEAHALATAALRTHDHSDADGDRAATRIGIAHNVRVFDAAGGPIDRLVAKVADDFYNRAIPDAVANGHIHISLPMSITIDQPAPGLRGSFDWLGINYYTRDVVESRLVRAMFGKGAPYQVVTDAARPRSDMGWEIYPEGLYRLLVNFASYGWPLIVTESGLADRSGDVRPGYIRSHIYAIDRARADGVQVTGYFHWSLMDNFEWSHGYEGRFGLYTIDFAGDPTLARRPTPAVAVFQKLAQAIGIARTN
ncbi:MAG: glycoside hydrolase family 1 protein [Deltaproteobacteria bacterium]|nr:glycoside hydrolase family 1 protein [Deltaproteobacteria bacterium]